MTPLYIAYIIITAQTYSSLEGVIDLTNNNTSSKNTYEIERKFLIAYPNIEQLKTIKDYSEAKLSQTYLKSSPKTNGMRIRKSTQHGKSTYTKTYKKDISAIKRIEIEDEITEDEYKLLQQQADTHLNPIEKTRLSFSYLSQRFELDIYTFWKDRATLELELQYENQIIKIPPFLTVIKEVTADQRYRNHSLSKKIINEPLGEVFI